MTDEYRHAGQGTHDTTVYGFNPTPPPIWAPNEPSTGAASSAPEAEYWADRYRRERTRSRALLITTLVAGVLAVGLGVGAYRAVTADPQLDAASSSATGTPPDPSGGADGDAQTSPPEGGTTPEAPSDGGAAPDTGVDGQTLPIPESLQGLASVLGITDVGDLLQLGVDNGLITEEQADQIRAGLTLAGVGGESGSGPTDGSTT